LFLFVTFKLAHFIEIKRFLKNQQEVDRYEKKITLFFSYGLYGFNFVYKVCVFGDPQNLELSGDAV
jgi:hypothetical protein